MMRNITFGKLFRILILVVVFIVFMAPMSVASGDAYGPGRVPLKILAGHDHVEAGYGGMWNSRDKLHIQLDPAEGWRISSYKVDLGGGLDYSPPLTPTGNPKIGHFDYKEEFAAPYENENNEADQLYRRTLVLDLDEDLGVAWGSPFADLRTQGVAIFLNLVKLDGAGQPFEESGAWVVPELVVWIPVEDDEAEGEDEVVADDETGEITEKQIKNVKKTSGGRVHKNAHQNAQNNGELDETFDLVSFDGGRWGWWFRYEIAHPMVGHFKDSHVAGLGVETPTYEGITNETGSFDYFPGEEVEIAIGSVPLGSTVADRIISPLDIFPLADTEDISVINMARLLQSLDVDADVQAGINITEEVVGVFEGAMQEMGLTSIDFDDEYEVPNLINLTVEMAGALDEPILLVAVSAEDAKAHLDESTNYDMFRKNISKTPELGSTKAKMNICTVWFPAMKANDEPTEIEYFDEDGDLLDKAEVNGIDPNLKAKPIIITYTDADPNTHAMDTWAAISRDDGNTWKRKNLSRSGDLTSFTLANGEEYYGYCKKPVFQVKGNKILVGWTSKFAKGGKPRYSEEPVLDDDGNNTNVNYTDDIWGVGGPQRSVDYVTEGYPEAGEIPYSCVWTCRGVIATPADVLNGVGEFEGDIVWFKPERLTSARRDANLIFLAGASSAGFGMVWQEDPKGLRPGRAIGPGPGWGGATTNHKTDIWYSFVSWSDFSKIDSDFVPGGDPEHTVQYDEDGNLVDFITRPKALVSMSLPIRISDNEVLNEKNMGLDTTSLADDVAYLPENLTRCVKFEGGKVIVEADDPRAYDGTADYTTLRAVPEDHETTMNCTNCHVPFGTDPMGTNPTQGAPIPVVVLDSETNDYLGGFDNGDCVSCHWSNIVPRDRLIAMTPGLDEDAKCAECEASGGVWYDGLDGAELVEAYYPYDGYPLIFDEGDVNDGTHRYGLELPGLLVDNPDADIPDNPNFFLYTNFNATDTSVGITLGLDGEFGTVDDLLMDGDTGASRGNLFMQPYTYETTNGDGETVTATSAWAIVTYEETKGAGAGPPDNTGESDTHRDDYLPESGKNVIYHSFDFKNPDMVSAGDIMNMPECMLDDSIVSDSYGNEIVMPLLDDDGNIKPKYLTSEVGDLILDWKGRPQIAYENARRGRFILQGWGAVRSSRTVMMMVYKMGMEGAGRPSDIMTQTWQIPEDEIAFTYYPTGKIKGVSSVVGNPYRFENIVGNRVQDGIGSEGETDGDGNSISHSGSGQWFFGTGAQNMSSVTPTLTTPSTGEPQYDDAYGAVKVVQWEQSVENLADLSDKNRYDDARAHRGQLRGDFVQLGFSYCANWAASRNGNDKYDFYLRRSFDGGLTWTTDPAGSGTEHCITWIEPSGTTEVAGTKTEDCLTFGIGEFERMRNLTQLPNSKESIIEPRVVAVPGTIKKNGVWTGLPEDKQNTEVFYVAWGTSTNPKKDPITGEQEEPHPTDLYWSFSRDKGETYHEVTWEVNGEPINEEIGDTVTGTPWMAKGDQEQGEVQLRMTPDGAKFYASWLDEGEEGSDIVFRRIMSVAFPQNDAATIEEAAAAAAAAEELEPDENSSDDFADNSGGE